MNKISVLLSIIVLLLFTCPSEGNSRERNDATPVDIILVLDNSGSMKKNDPQFLTREVVTNFLRELGPESRLGTVIFDQDARLAVPLMEIGMEGTENTLLEALKQVDYKGKFTDSPAAIEKALYELKTNGREEASKVIIFLTDGIIDTGDKGEDLEKAKWLKEDLAQESKNLGIRIFGIAFTDQADFHLIQSLAVQTKGEYFKALKAENIQGIFNKISEVISRPVIEPVPPEAQTTQVAPPQTPQQPTAEQTAQVTPPQAPQQPAAEQTEQVTPPRNQQEGEAARSTELLDQLPLPLIIAGIVVLLGIAAIWLVFKKKPAQGPVQTGPKGPQASPAPSAETLPKARLLDNRSKFFDKPIMIRKKLTRIGRDPNNDIQIPEDTVSGQHALIEFDSGSFFLEDTGSANGTRLDDRKIKAYRKYRLKNESKITIDTFEFTFNLPEQAQAGDGAKTVLRSAGSPPAEHDRNQVPDIQPQKDASTLEKHDNETMLKPGMCPNHHTIRATEMCFVCKGAFCTSCLTEKDEKKICYKCADNKD